MRYVHQNYDTCIKLHSAASLVSNYNHIKLPKLLVKLQNRRCTIHVSNDKAWLGAYQTHSAISMGPDLRWALPSSPKSSIHASFPSTSRDIAPLDIAREVLRPLHHRRHKKPKSILGLLFRTPVVCASHLGVGRFIPDVELSKTKDPTVVLLSPFRTMTIASSSSRHRRWWLLLLAACLFAAAATAAGIEEEDAREDDGDAKAAPTCLNNNGDRSSCPDDTAAITAATNDDNNIPCDLYWYDFWMYAGREYARGDILSYGSYDPIIPFKQQTRKAFPRWNRYHHFHQVDYRPYHFHVAPGLSEWPLECHPRLYNVRSTPKNLTTLSASQPQYSKLIVDRIVLPGEPILQECIIDERTTGLYTIDTIPYQSLDDGILQKEGICLDTVVYKKIETTKDQTTKQPQPNEEYIVTAKRTLQVDDVITMGLAVHMHRAEFE
jgi:hypothetical protein